MIWRVIIFTVLLLLVVRAVRLLIAGAVQGASGPRRPQAPPVRLVRDPVCGTHVAPRNALSLTSGGSTHYFCSEECRQKFRE